MSEQDSGAEKDQDPTAKRLQRREMMGR